jgi:hypothetical protein
VGLWAAAPEMCRQSDPRRQDVSWYEGNDESYVGDLTKRDGAANDQPHRTPVEKLVRASSRAPGGLRRVASAPTS